MNDTQRRTWPALIDFEGRVARLPFAGIALGAGLATPVMIDFAISNAQHLGASIPSGDIPAALRLVPASLALPMLIIDCIALFAVALILLSFEVRRLHDMNLTGWFVLARIVLYALHLPDVDPFPPTAFLIWSLLLAIVPGTAGPNSYGLAKT